MLRRYLAKRLLVAIPSLVIASVIVFTLPRLLPGDAVQLMVEEKAYGKDIDDLRAKLGLDRCHLAVTSTAPCRPEVHEFWAALGLPLYEVWGMSELTGPATVVPMDDHQAPSIGPPMPGVEVRLGEDGELLVRGGNVMVGYYKEPGKTSEIIDAEGWVHSGDIAEPSA